MADPAITVLMPLKNYHAEFLNKAVVSVLEQTCPHWLLRIVVEPEDEVFFSKLLAGTLRHDRVAILANEGRKLAGAVNTGMRRATTPFAALLLADDLWAPDAVAVLDRAITEHPDVDFFHSSRQVIDEEDRPISAVYRSRAPIRPADFLRGSPVKHLLCWRVAKALSFGGLDERINNVGPDDYDFPWTMAEQGARFMAVPECLYLYRDHREAFRLTTHLPLSVHTREINYILRKHGVAFWQRRRYLAAAKKNYLKQCLFKSRLDRRIRQGLDLDPRTGWRESYRPLSE